MRLPTRYGSAGQVCSTRVAQRCAARGGPAAMRLYPRRLLCTGLAVLGLAHVLALATLTPTRFPVAALLGDGALGMHSCAHP